MSAPRLTTYAVRPPRGASKVAKQRLLVSVCARGSRFHHLVAALSVPALAAVTTPAWAEMVDIAWDADGRFERSVTVPNAKFAEFCGKLPAGLKVRWDFEASAPLDFNIHYHVGKDVVFPSKLSAAATAKDVLQTRIEQDYCWMWSNKTASAATLKLKLQR